MPRYNLDFDREKLPKPGTYFCTKPGCNGKQIIHFYGQQLKPCPKCGKRDFSTP